MVSNHTPRVYATVTAHVKRTETSALPWLVYQDVEGALQPLGAAQPALISHNNNPGVSCRMPPADTVASSYRMKASNGMKD